MGEKKNEIILFENKGVFMRWQILNDLDYKHYMQEYKINSLLAKIFAYKNHLKPHLSHHFYFSSKAESSNLEL